MLLCSKWFQSCILLLDEALLNYAWSASTKFCIISGWFHEVKKISLNHSMSEWSSTKEWNSVRWKLLDILNISSPPRWKPNIAAAALLWLLFHTEVTQTCIDKGQADGRGQSNAPGWGHGEGDLWVVLLLTDNVSQEATLCVFFVLLKSVRTQKYFS